MFHFNDLIALAIFATIGITVMVKINATIALAVFLPLTLVVVAANRVRKRIEAYRKASREATGSVTGFLGELFGAVQAVQVAGAEERVILHFHQLNEARRKTGLRDRLFTDLLESVFWNTVNLGTGLILILAASSIRSWHLHARRLRAVRLLPGLDRRVHRPLRRDAGEISAGQRLVRAHGDAATGRPTRDAGGA